MRLRKLFSLILVILLVVSFVGCGKDSDKDNDKTPEPTDTPVPTATPEPTDTPEPTPEPTPDPDADVDAILYRFALEGEDIIYSMFDGMDINATNAEIEFTEEGLFITVVDLHDPYFLIPLPDGAIDVTKYPIMKMLFKNSSKTPNGEFYMGFDGEAITGIDQNVSYSVEPTDDWQDVYLNFSEIRPNAETLTTFRADLLANPPVDSTITVDYIGFFTSMEAAQEYTPPNRR